MGASDLRIDFQGDGTPGVATTWEGASGTQQPAGAGRKTLWLILAASLGVRVSASLHLVPDYLFDDGYITFRYAVHLARGWGFVFNRGEHIWGTTTPLFTMLLAGLGRVFGIAHIETIALILCILFFVGAMWATAAVLRRAGVPPPLARVYLIVLGVFPAFVSISVSGMETPIVLFLMALSLLLFERGRFGAAAFLCGLLLLARIDTVIWTGVLGLHLLFENHEQKLQQATRAAGVFLATILPWYVFAAIYFHNVIPQSLVGKAVSHGAFHLFDKEYLLAFLASFVPGAQSSRVSWLTIPLTLGIVAAGVVHLWRRFPVLRPLATFLICYNVAFLLGRAPLFEWYFVPVKWAYYFVALCGLAGLHELAGARRLPRLDERLAWTMLGALTLVYGGWRLRPLLRAPAPRVWTQVSTLIEKNTGANARVFLEHIGLVGYKTDRYIYDAMGLVTPRTVAIKRAYGEDWLPKAAREFDAEVVVFYPEDVERMGDSHDADAAWFWQNYSLADTLQAPDAKAFVFFRKDGPQVSPAAAGQPETISGKDPLGAAQ
jgi:hypothetical protein